MKIKDLILKLKEYNPESKVSVILNNEKYGFELNYGDSDDCKKNNCDFVYFYISNLNTQDKAKG